MMIDIDYFKQYNDFYGHPEGDEVLKAVASAFSQKVIRGNDYVFRLGGEEFGIFMECNNCEKIESFINKIHLSIIDLKIKHEKSTVNEYVTISSGTVIIDKNSTLEIDSIYKKADKLLYKAKDEGRNKFLIEKI